VRVGSVKKGLATASKKAKLKKVSPHMLRHSAAVRMAEDGVPMEEIASYLGHSDVNVTRKVYARFSPDHLRGAAAALELDDLTAPPGSTNQRAVRKGSAKPFLSFGENGGRGWDRTSDPYDVNVVLSR
jgi:hypothetical protein